MGEPFASLKAVQNALKDRGSPEVEAAVGKYFSAASRLVSSEIYGITDTYTTARCRLEQSEAEHAIILLFPGRNNG